MSPGMAPTNSAYAVLLISGTDAGEFLNAQLTTDVPRLEFDQHRLSAWCDPKGRALCIMRVVAAEAGYLVILPAGLAAGVSRRLRMFILRSRVEVTDVSSEWRVSGELDPATNGNSRAGHGQVLRDGGGLLLGLNTGTGPVMLRLQPAREADEALPPVSTAWQLAEIDAGLPEVTSDTSALFVPQMLNLHWLGAIDFNKGCYPGQEVIARLQYRGRLTRRMFRLRWHGQTPEPGDAVLAGDNSHQGTVVRAAHSSPGEGRLLAVLRIGAVEQALACGTTRLSLLDLPYATDEQAVAR